MLCGKKNKKILTYIAENYKIKASYVIACAKSFSYTKIPENVQQIASISELPGLIRGICEVPCNQEKKTKEQTLCGE